MKILSGLVLILALAGCQIQPTPAVAVDVEIAVGSGGMIARSLDHGQTWETVMGFKTQEFKGNVQVDADLIVKGELNKGRFAQMDALASGLGQLNGFIKNGFLGNLYARGTFYQQLGQQWVGPISNPFAATDTIFQVAYGNGVYVAVGSTAGGVGRIARSTDNGATWGALIGNPFVANGVISIAFGGSVFVSVGNGGDISRSTDFGVTWSALIANSFGGDNIISVAYGNGVFIATTQTGKISRSTDLGVTWSALVANPFGVSAINSISFGSGVFVACSSSGVISRSTDLGVSWSSAITNPFGGSDLTASISGNGIFVVVGGAAGVAKIAKSVDLGLTWGSLITNPFTTQLESISYNFGIFQAGSITGTTARSYDNGVTWGSLISNPFGANIIYCIVSSTSNMAAVGAAGSIATAGWNAVFSSAPEQLYVPTFTGFGTPSNVNFSWRMIANRAKFLGQLTSGISTATEARVSLPFGMTSDSSLISAIQVCGFAIYNATALPLVACLIEPGKGYITFGIQNATNAGTTKVNGNGLISAGNILNMAFEVPISGLNV